MGLSETDKIVNRSKSGVECQHLGGINSSCLSRTEVSEDITVRFFVYINYYY